MFTLKLPYLITNQNYFIFLQQLRREQSAAYRSAYQLAFQQKLKEKEIRKKLKEKFQKPQTQLDSWFLQSALCAGIAAAKTDHKLKIKKRIFGGKKNFYRRAKKYISNQEWKEQRLEKLYLIGEAPSMGNRKFIFEENKIIFKPFRKIKFELILPKLKQNYQKDYQFLLKESKKKNLAITVRLDQKFIYLVFDESKLKEEIKPIKNHYLGIDLNPNYIGVVFFKENQTLLSTKLYNLSQLTGKRSNPNKLKHELREIGHQIGRIANYYQIKYFFLEELKFKQGDKKKGKRFNRLTINQFLIIEFKRILRKYGKIIELNAKFSSTIGNIMHPDQPDPIAAAMEIARRGIESRIVVNSGKFFPPLVAKCLLANRWKEAQEWHFETWIELHYLLKTTGVKYRVPIPSIGMFRRFKSSILYFIFLTSFLSEVNHYFP